MTSPVEGLWRAVDGLGTDVRLSVHYDRPRGLLLVRSQGDAASLTPRMQSAIRSVDPLFAVWSAVTSSELLARSLEPQRVSALTTGGLGLAGLILSACGIYGWLAVRIQRVRSLYAWTGGL